MPVKQDNTVSYDKFNREFRTQALNLLHYLLRLDAEMTGI